MFRSRPLTWLFFIATATADLAMILPVLRAEGAAGDMLPRVCFFLGIPAQLSVAAVWAAIGRSHRLARASLLALGLFVATLLARWFPDYSWHDLLAIYLLQTLMVWGGAFVLRMAGWLSGWPTMELASQASSPHHTEKRMQFSLVEMFGWTTIVAIGAVGARHATYAHLHGDWVMLVNLVSVPLLVVAALGRCRTGWVRWILALAIPIGAALLAVKLTAGTIEPFMGRAYLLLDLTQAGTLALWHLVQRLDLESRVQCPATSPSIPAASGRGQQ